MIASIIACAALLPRAWYGRSAETQVGTEPALNALARGVARAADADAGLTAFRTGSTRFDGE